MSGIPYGEADAVKAIILKSTDGGANWEPDVTGGGSGGGGGHTIQEDTVDLTQRTNLNFGSGLTASDNAGNDATDVILASHTHVEADITDLGSYSTVGHTHVEADITDLDHWTEADHDALDHTGLTGIISDHGGLSGLTDDDHVDYIRHNVGGASTSRATDAIIIGSTASGGDLHLRSTSHATKGSIILDSGPAFEKVSNQVRHVWDGSGGVDYQGYDLTLNEYSVHIANIKTIWGSPTEGVQIADGVNVTINERALIGVDADPADGLSLVIQDNITHTTGGTIVMANFLTQFDFTTTNLTEGVLFSAGGAFRPDAVTLSAIKGLKFVPLMFGSNSSTVTLLESIFAGTVIGGATTYTEIIGLSVRIRHIFSSHSVTDYIGVKIDEEVDPTWGSTVKPTRSTGMKILDLRGTTFTGIDILSQSTPTTSYSLRSRGSAAYMRHRGAAVIGADSSVLNDEILRVIQQTSTGVDVMAIQTTAATTTDRPTERVLQRDVATTDATVTTMYSSTTAQGHVYTVEYRIYARQTSGTGQGDGFFFHGFAVWQNVSGVLTKISDTQLVTENSNDTNFAVTTDVTGTTLRVRVAGDTSQPTDWHGIFRVYDINT